MRRSRGRGASGWRRSQSSQASPPFHFNDGSVASHNDGQGVITCLLNPKAYYFMFAIYTQFLQPEKGAFRDQIIILSTIIAVVQIAIYGGSAWSMSKLAGSLGGGEALEIQLSGAMGVSSSSSLS